MAPCMSMDARLCALGRPGRKPQPQAAAADHVADLGDAGSGGPDASCKADYRLRPTRLADNFFLLSRD